MNEPSAVDKPQSRWLTGPAPMCYLRIFLCLFAIAANGSLSGETLAQPASDADSPPDSPPRKPFAIVVKEYFSQWNKNGDGALSPDEIEAAVPNPAFHDEAAAAVAAIELVIRHGKYSLPPLTCDYLASSPLHEPSDSDEQANSADDESKPEKISHPPAFEPRYRRALRKLRQTSRDLFPQNLPSFGAAHQSFLGDCPFVSTVGAMVYRDPSAVKSMFTQNANGSTTVNLGRKPPLA